MASTMITTITPMIVFLLLLASAILSSLSKVDSNTGIYPKLWQQNNPAESAKGVSLAPLRQY
jgi:hypothetical protein